MNYPRETIKKALADAIYSATKQLDADNLVGVLFVIATTEGSQRIAVSIGAVSTEPTVMLRVALEALVTNSQKNPTPDETVPS